MVDTDVDELEELEEWLRSERELRHVQISREYEPTAPGEMGVLADCLQFVVDAGLIGVLAQSLVDYWRSRGANRDEDEKPALRIERTDAPDGTRTVVVEARDLDAAEAVLRELPRTFE
nr:MULTISPECIES: hypothetical protein [unclassified Streptomyces]